MRSRRTRRKYWTEMGNINAVMDGDIDGFINAFLKWEALGGRAKEAAADATAIR